VGGKLEDLVAGDLRRTMAGEEAFMREWLAGRG
jgi:hypothetical protein